MILSCSEKWCVNEFNNSGVIVQENIDTIIETSFTNATFSEGCEENIPSISEGSQVNMTIFDIADDYRFRLSLVGNGTENRTYNFSEKDGLYVWSDSIVYTMRPLSVVQDGLIKE